MGEEHARGAEPGDALAATSSADANPTDRADGETVITQQLIAKCATRAETRRGQDEPLDKYLARLTHLKMDGRNIVHIDALGCAPGVRVLYLYDNAIRRMTNLAPLPHLTHLYLQNNALTRVEGLTSCVNLQKALPGR
jgi:protein phosphatase 1 regulatory subunit 42